MRIIKFEEGFVEAPKVGKNGETEMVMESDDKVTLAPDGASSLSSQTVHRIRRIDPANMAERYKDTPGHKMMLARWAEIEPHYKAWKESTSLPVEGTPLAAWPAMTRQIVERLKPYGVVTVEQVRDMGPDMIKVIQHPDAARFPKIAAEYLEGKGAEAIRAERDEERAENEALKGRLEEIEAMLAAKNDAADADAPAEPKKRGPGRPPKNPDAEAAA